MCLVGKVFAHLVPKALSALGKQGLWHVLKIPRKGSIVVPCFALCCLFAFIWHLSLTLSVA